VYFLQTPICVSTDGGAQDNITVRGATRDTISPDLTKQIVIDPKYRMSDYGTLRWIDASSRKAGWLATGSDDGLIFVTEDDGKTWRKAAALPGVPAGSSSRRRLWSKRRSGYSAKTA